VVTSVQVVVQHSILWHSTQVVVVVVCTQVAWVGSLMACRAQAVLYPQQVAHSIQAVHTPVIQWGGGRQVGTAGRPTPGTDHAAGMALHCTVGAGTLQVRSHSHCMGGQSPTSANVCGKVWKCVCVCSAWCRYQNKTFRRAILLH